MNFTAKIFSVLKNLGGLYMFLFFYDYFFWVYTTVLIYHIRWALEWISALVPIQAFYMIFTVVFAWGIYKFIKRLNF